MVVALSPSAKASPYVNEEIDLALNKSIPLFPLIVHGSEKTAVPDSLISIQHYNASETRFDDGVRKLVDALYDYAGIDFDQKIDGGFYGQQHYSL